MNTKFFNINFSSCQKRNNGGCGGRDNSRIHSIPGHTCQGCGCKVTNSVYCYACQ
jgi:hypothetical protein